MNTPTGQSILVTGGAGFIGSHLVETLVTDNDVTVLDNLSSGRREWIADQAALIEADIRNSEAVAAAAAGADIIFHEAANVSVERSVEEPVDSHEVNVDSTLQLLECARKEDARFIYASSAAVYGTPDSVPIQETDPKAPASPYGLEKLTADEYCRLYNELYDIKTITLRYFNVTDRASAVAGTAVLSISFLNKRVMEKRSLFMRTANRRAILSTSATSLPQTALPR